MSLEKVKEFFKGTEMDGKIIELEKSSATVELAAEALSCDGDTIAKTLSFLADGIPVVIVVSGK
jgi:prolyl-tRNA editing enzyme YbaK/EbsC (Cys-tRNA(Pro) deacylase)